MNNLPRRSLFRTSELPKNDVVIKNEAEQEKELPKNSAVDLNAAIDVIAANTVALWHARDTTA